MVKKSSYWKNRTKELMQYAEQQDKVMFQELTKLYGETFKDVQKEIFAFYAKYAEDNKITIQEAKQRLRRTDLSDYRENARRYREEVKTPELLERLNEQYVSSKATRLDALKLDLTYQLGLLQGKVSGSFDSYLKKLAKHSYRKISGGLSDSTLNEPALEQLVKTPFKGYNYSQQVWGNVDHLAKDLHKTLTRGFVKGFSPHEMATEIRKRHDVAKHRAETLVRTDGSMVINNATLKRYKDVGLKFYRIHVHIDSRTSDICMNISKLDKAYKLSEAQPGYNMPPLHPNCRSTIVPDDEDMDRADDRDVEEVRRLLGKEADGGYNEAEVTRMTITGHANTPKQATPNSVIDRIGFTGKVTDRSFYDDLGMKYKAIHTTDHGNRKQHPYGEYGEHAHDFIWNEDGSLDSKISRELTDEERRDNNDIL